MSGAYTGGCACGAIRYEISDQPTKRCQLPEGLASISATN